MFNLLRGLCPIKSRQRLQLFGLRVQQRSGSDYVENKTVNFDLFEMTYGPFTCMSHCHGFQKPEHYVFTKTTV